MVEQIGASLTCGGNAAIAVVDLQQSISKEVAACRTPNTEVVDGDIGSLDGCGVTHIDNLVAPSTAIENERGTLQVAPVVETTTLREYQLIIDLHIIGILQ